MSKRSADSLIGVLNSWLGWSEKNGKHEKIIDIYNSQKNVPQGYRPTYKDSWCDVTISAAAITAGMTDLIGVECGVQRHVEKFKKMGIWQEDGTTEPKRGWIIVYSWRTGKQPNDSFADHIGVVTDYKDGVITCIEGNCNDAVSMRVIPRGWKYIRGFAMPKYNEEKKESQGKVDEKVISSAPKWVGEVTASKLSVRVWAGTEYARIKSWPYLGRGNWVDVCDEVKDSKGDTWYFVRIQGSIFGFCHSRYIKRVEI